MGDGRPAYTSIRTKEEMAPEPQTPLVPPVGLMAIVLSARSVVVYWTDTTLSKNQVSFGCTFEMFIVCGTYLIGYYKNNKKLWGIWSLFLSNQ